MDIQSRLSAYIEYKHLTNKDFERLCGLGNGTAAAISEKTRDSTYDRISNACKDLNIEWLRTGSGDMLVAAPPAVRQSDEQPPINELCQLVPVVHTDSVGGMHSQNSMLSPEYIERYIPIAGARRGDLAIYQSGNSMTPAIPPGALLLIREVEGWREYLGYGDVFVLLLDDERRITKEIRRYDEDPKNFFWCVSYNPDVADEELPKRMVRRVWKVIKVLIDKGW